MNGTRRGEFAPDQADLPSVRHARRLVTEARQDGAIVGAAALSHAPDRDVGAEGSILGGESLRGEEGASFAAYFERRPVGSSTPIQITRGLLSFGKAPTPRMVKLNASLSAAAAAIASRIRGTSRSSVSPRNISVR